MSNKIGKKNQVSKAGFNPQNRVIFAFFLIVIGILSRTVLHIGNNVEFVTTASLLSGSFLGLGWGIFVPLVIMAVSDLVIGNTLIYIFTWSAYLLIGFIGFFFLRGKENTVNKIIKATFMGIISSIIFFLWTNFGVWVLDSFSMYPDSLSGLMDSYIMGIPFFKANLLGNLFFVPVSFLIFPRLFSFNFKKSILNKIIAIN